jgi:hypothetical protein
MKYHVIDAFVIIIYINKKRHYVEKIIKPRLLITVSLEFEYATRSNNLWKKITNSQH